MELIRINTGLPGLNVQHSLQRLDIGMIGAVLDVSTLLTGANIKVSTETLPVMMTLPGLRIPFIVKAGADYTTIDGGIFDQSYDQTIDGGPFGSTYQQDIDAGGF